MGHMLRRDTTLVKGLISLFLVAGLVAQTQIATVTGSSPFKIHGANVTPGQGVPSWPLTSGDTIQAGSTPVTVTFPDGSTIILAPDSTAKVFMSGPTPEFELTKGTAHYMLNSLNSVKLAEGSMNVTPTSVTGDLNLGSNKPPAGWWTAGHTALVVGGSAGAAALAVGIAQSKKTSKCGQNQQGNNNCQ